MPPQQAESLLDLINCGFDFGSHKALILDPPRKRDAARRSDTAFGMEKLEPSKRTWRGFGQ
jgi:hypothetical protein